jgi:hypothetical protein
VFGGDTGWILKRNMGGDEYVSCCEVLYRKNEMKLWKRSEVCIWVSLVVIELYVTGRVVFESDAATQEAVEPVRGSRIPIVGN